MDHLRAHVGQDDVWFESWTRLASLLEKRAQDNLAVGTPASAGENYFLASLYHKMAEQFVPPADPSRMQSYERVLDTFEPARSMTEYGIERVLVADEAGQKLPAYFIPAENRSGPNPVVIFLSGLDTTKEISYLRLRDKLAKRGISCLAVIRRASAKRCGWARFIPATTTKFRSVPRSITCKLEKTWTPNALELSAAA